MNTRSTRSTLASSLLLAALSYATPHLLGETVTGQGRVLPVSGVVDVAGLNGDTIQKINVHEGDLVEAGQSLATLSSASEAAKKVAQKQADLESTKQSNAATIDIDRKNLELMALTHKYSSDRYQRILAAHNSEFISADQAPDREVQMRTDELSEAKAKVTLDNAIRDADKAVRAAEADLKAAKDQLALAEVHSPIRAKVLKVRARPGATAAGPLFKIGDTSSMVVVAEIFEAEALKLKVGQHATVSSTALPGKMGGSVQSVSSIVYRNSIDSTDPNDTGESRIVEVTIKMDDPSPLDRLVFLQVDVVIDL